MTCPKYPLLCHILVVNANYQRERERGKEGEVSDGNRIEERRKKDI